VLLLAVSSCGCAHSIYTDLEREMGIRSLHPPPNMTCKDGRPVKLIVGSPCNMGICGWTCQPDRWADEEWR